MHKSSGHNRQHTGLTHRNRRQRLDSEATQALPRGGHGVAAAPRWQSDPPSVDSPSLRAFHCPSAHAPTHRPRASRLRAVMDPATPTPAEAAQPVRSPSPSPLSRSLHDDQGTRLVCRLPASATHTQRVQRDVLRPARGGVATVLEREGGVDVSHWLEPPLSAARAPVWRTPTGRVPTIHQAPF